MATCFLADASEQGREEYFCQRMDGFVIPKSISSKTMVDVDPGLVFRRFIMPLSTCGQGETDLEHKAARTVHTGWMITGCTDSFVSWRQSVRCFCGDQGTERGLCDMPRVDDLEKLQETLQRHLDNPDLLVCSDPDAFFFPRAILVTGPLHIVWKAFEVAVVKVPCGGCL